MARARGPRRRREALPSRALRRHAPARRAGAGAGHRSRRATDGRASRLAGRAHARGPARRGDGPVGGDVLLRPVRDARPGRGRRPRRQGRRARRTARAGGGRGRRSCRATATAPAGARERAARRGGVGARAAAGMRGRSAAWDVAVAAATVLVVSLALEAWTRALRVPGYLFPAPSAVAARLAGDPGFFAAETVVTVAEAAGGFALGAALAFAAASAMAFSRALERTIFPVAILVKLTPIVAVAPLFTLWFGFGSAPKVAIAGLITFFPMLVNAFVGLRSVDPQELAFLETLGASPREVFWRLRAPSAP